MMNYGASLSAGDEGASLGAAVARIVGAEKAAEMDAIEHLRILVVEDDETFSYALCRLLDNMKSPTVETVAVSTLAEAVVAIPRQRTDVVLLDLKLPNGQGLQAIERIINAPQAPPCVVVITGLDVTEEEQLLALELGVQEYLTKDAVSSRGSSYLRTMILRARYRQRWVRRTLQAAARYNQNRTDLDDTQKLAK